MAVMRALVFVLALLALMLAAPERSHALSRPGGGHGYSGGGGGSHSSGSSGSSRSSSSGSSSRGSRDDEELAELIIVLASTAFRTTRDYPLVMWRIWGVVALGIWLK